MKISIIVILFFTKILIYSQVNEDYYLSWMGGFPISKLVQNIELKENSVFLFADFNSVDSNQVTIYLINNSDSNLTFDGYELALLQEEHKDVNLNWVRSNSYYFGWCGTQYSYTVEVKPYHFAIFKEYLNSSGVKSKVRYNLLNSEVEPSNVGDGFYSQKEVEKTIYDDISLQINGSAFLKSIILNGIPNYSGKRKKENITKEAIRYLAFYYPDEAITILNNIAKDSTNNYQSTAKYSLERLRTRKKYK